MLVQYSLSNPILVKIWDPLWKCQKDPECTMVLLGHEITGKSPASAYLHVSGTHEQSTSSSPWLLNYLMMEVVRYVHDAREFI